MDIIEKVKKYVLEKSEWHKNTEEDQYDFWEEHIKYVYKESVLLAEKYQADVEIVKLGALLHDIALICKIEPREKHNETGEKLAQEILTNMDYPEEKMERVLKCVYNHRSSKNATSIEELCVADADILAHFDNIPMLFDVFFNLKKLNLNEVHVKLKEYLAKDYDDLSEKTKEEFKEKYEKILDVLSIS